MTHIARIQLAAGAWVIYPEPLRAVMPLRVTLRGFDSHDLIPDLAGHLADVLPWGELYETIVPVDSAPIESVDLGALAKRIGGIAVQLDEAQPAPVYMPDSYQAGPDQVDVRVMLMQAIGGARSADRDMLIGRRRDLEAAVITISGNIEGPPHPSTFQVDWKDGDWSHADWI